MTDTRTLSPDTTKNEVAQLVADFKNGQISVGVQLFDAASMIDDLVTRGAQLNKPILLGEDLLFVQPDGSIIGLLDAAKSDILLTDDKFLIPVETLLNVALRQQDWEILGDAIEFNLAQLSTGAPDATRGSGEQEQVLSADPLIGLEISPLLPPTDYTFPEREEEDIGDGGIGESQIEFPPFLGVLTTVDETDDVVDIVIADTNPITANEDQGEEITSVSLTIPGLPLGATSTAGTFVVNGTTKTLVFTGSLAEYNALTLTFPKDFSTESRNDFAEGDLTATLSASSNFEGEAQTTFPIAVRAEGDLGFVGSGRLETDETNAVVILDLSDALVPQATDADGSESVDFVSLTLATLPAGARISTDGGASFTAVPTQYSFQGSLAAYDELRLELPADFSTTNPLTRIRGTLRATTDEGADQTRTFDLVVNDTPDIVVQAPASLTAAEDGDGADGGGVTVNLQLNVFTTDADGSEDNMRVSIQFTDLPPGTGFSTGLFSAGTGLWVGTAAEANTLSLKLPGDYAGSFSSVVTARNPEGTASASQTVTITPTGDVDIAVTPIVTDETDDVVVVNPSAAWQVSVSDSDTSPPFETLTSVRLVLNDLPPGMAFRNVPDATISYNATTGGTLIFDGTGVQYSLLRLVFPQDFSTENPGIPAPAISGTIAATSTEGTNGPTPVSITINAEGDATIDTLPFAELTESETTQTVLLRDLLTPRATDADMSENITSLTIMVTGLPGTLTTADLVGFVGLNPQLVAAADSSLTLSATVNSGNIGTIYDGLGFVVPIDFSTTSRSDLTPTGGQVFTQPPSLPITYTLALVTDEGGTATGQAQVVVNDEKDITLTVPNPILAQEDGGILNSSAGVQVPLGIIIDITDDDLSEDQVSGAPFGTVVTIDFTDLPAGATLTEPGLVGSTWTGSVADARTLAINFPGDYAGIVLANVTVTTTEGFESSPTVILVQPTPDVLISGDVATTETDSIVTVLLSDFITITLGPGEDIFSLQFELPDLPAMTTVTDSTGANVGTFTPDGNNRFTFNFDSLSEPGVNIAGVSISFPKDFSTENPNNPLQATVDVSVIQPPGPPSAPVSATVNFTIDAEGDVVIDKSGDASLQETDAPVDFRPSDFLTPRPTDDDTSESIQNVLVAFNDLPSGTLFSVNGGAFAASSATLDFIGDLAAYNSLIIRLPADFSTENPASVLTGTVIATTDEFGAATETFDVSVAAEGDLTLVGSGRVTVSENDAPGSVDLDNTTQAPQVIRLADAITAMASDADTSDEIVDVAILLQNLPMGTLRSLDGGITFPDSDLSVISDFSVNSITAYENIVFRFPDDFSTDTAGGAITGTVVFSTREGLLNGEDVTRPPTGGVLEQAVTIEITQEADIQITGRDITVIEDLGAPIDLEQMVAAVDIDMSETISSVSITFANLPANGSTVLSDGTVLTRMNNVWTGTATEIANLQIDSFPTHFSGVVTMTTNVVTNESGLPGQSAVFTLSVTPVAEPQIALSLDTGRAGTTALSADQYSVKEDTTFVLEIDASTPDKDTSETLRDIVIENVPNNWVRNSGGVVDLSRFETGASDIDSATVSGTTLTITLKPGLTDFNGALRMRPRNNRDSDVDTLTMGGEMTATVTSVDTATGLAPNIGTANAQLDIDVDAVIDPLTITTADQSTTETQSTPVFIDAGITGLTLTDRDGSEEINTVSFTLSIATLSTDIDTAIANGDVRLDFGANASFVTVATTDTDLNDQSVAFTISRPTNVSNADFTAALTGMQVVFPTAFSGQATLNGSVDWAEAADVDAEFDFSDNAASQNFSTVLTVDPLAQAELRTSVFVTDSTFVDDGTPFTTGRPEQVTGEALGNATDVSVDVAEALILLESTDDASGPGQVRFFFGLNAQTTDTDGSESLQDLVISNVPTSWIGVSETTQSVTLTRQSFFNEAGSAVLSQTEFDKIDTAAFDATTGEVTLTFKTGITDFAASLPLYPALYEDYDVDRGRLDRFSADGEFWDADLNVALRTRDGNTITTDTRTSDVTFDVDVDPVNNQGVIDTAPRGNEAVIDAAGGVFDFSFLPAIRDMDGSETIVAVVLRDVPDIFTVYVPDPNNPSGDKIPALITNINGDGTIDWSLDAGEWNEVELRGVPTHYAGTIVLGFDIVTREANGRTGVTSLTNVQVIIDPVVDGGDPSERERTFEDMAVPVVISGNIIDQTPESPEVILQSIEVFDVSADAFGRVPRFFDGVPNQTGTTPGGDPIFSNELLPLVAGQYFLTPSQAQNLYVLPGTDSNEDSVFKVRVLYQEVLEPVTQTKFEEGTITISVKGIADKPTVSVQLADPDDAAMGIDKNDINAVYRPDEFTGTVLNEDRAYAYAGFDNAPFQLDQRVTDEALELGYANVTGPVFTAADPITGDRTEITFGNGLPDGSETIYYLFSNVPPEIRFIGGSPVDSTNESYLVTGPDLAGIGIEASAVSEVTYYDLQFSAIVIEDDVDLANVPRVGNGTTVQDVLDFIDPLPGASVTSTEISIMVIPAGGIGPGPDCQPGDPEDLPIPELMLVGMGFEDTPNAYQIKITDVPGYWTGIGDLINLPNGVRGDFGFGITVPPGGSLSSQPPGAVLLDPVTGQYVIDFSVLGVDPTDDNLTAGSIIYTPPAEDSSPSPFPDNETLGTMDPYDDLPDLQFTSVLNNFTCSTFESTTGILTAEIAPVVDGPTIGFTLPGTILEDTLIPLQINVSSRDGGERLVGNITVKVLGDPTAQLIGTSGVISPDAGSGSTPTYTLTLADLTGLQLRPTEHLSGQVQVEVTATTQDLDLATKSGSSTATLDIEAVADTPFFEYNPDPTITDTGTPLVTDPTGPQPIVTILEDTRVFLRDIFVDGGSPDRDGSEAQTSVIGPIPDYLEIDSTFGTGLIDNGDGTFTIAQNASGEVFLRLKDDHARTPDALDPSIPSEIPITITVNTLEVSNADEETSATTFLLRVYPDADKPDVIAEIQPQTGAEDDGVQYTINISGNTPDPHETMSFEVKLPTGSLFFVNGVPQTMTPDDTYTVAAIPSPTSTRIGSTFTPADTLAFTPPPDFGGTASIDVFAITQDVSTTYSVTDTQRSDVAQPTVQLDVAPDLILAPINATLDLLETDAPLSFKPIDNLDLRVTDVDGSEAIETVTFELTGVPDGTTYNIGGSDIPVTGTLTFSGTETQFRDMVITFPRDFATEPGSLTANVTATSVDSGTLVATLPATFDVAIMGELDLRLEFTAPSSVTEQTGAPLVVPIAITAEVTDMQTTPSEVLQRVVVRFDSALPAMATVSAGVIAADRLSVLLEPGAQTEAQFADTLTNFEITLPDGFDGPIEGRIEGATNHGQAQTADFLIDVNARPDVSGPVDLGDEFVTSFDITFAELLANSTDTDTLTVDATSLATSDTDVSISVVGTTVTVTVPNGYSGMPTLTYDVVDDAVPPARSPASAFVDIDTLQMQPDGSPSFDVGGVQVFRMTDVTGDPAFGTVAKGTSGNDFVELIPGTADYAGITEFQLEDGQDIIDVSAATAGLTIDGGAGADTLTGTDFSDILIGAEGADVLFGGDGLDTFVLEAGTLTNGATVETDRIADYQQDVGSGAYESIDLSQEVNGVDDITGIVDFDASTGLLSINGDAAFEVNGSQFTGGIPPQVQVIFEDSAGAQQVVAVTG